MLDEVAFLLLGGGLSLAVTHPLFVVLALLGVVLLAMPPPPRRPRPRRPERAPPPPTTPTCAMRAAGAPERPRPTWDPDADVAAALMCRNRSPDWATYHGKARTSLQLHMEQELDARGNRDPHVVPFDHKACPLPQEW